MRQALLGIQPEQPPWREQLGNRHMLFIGLGPAAVGDVRRKPAGQVVRVVRLDAHARRVAIEGMPKLRGAVGLAASQFRPGFNQHDAPGTRQAQQLHGQQGAAQATANNQHIGLADGRGCLSGLWLAHGIHSLLDLYSATGRICC